jgi:hypothetical protein
VGFGGNNFIHLSDIGVVELAVVVYFTGEGGGHCLWNLLYGDSGGGETVSAQANLPVRAFTDDLSKGIVSDNPYLAR